MNEDVILQVVFDEAVTVHGGCHDVCEAFITCHRCAAYLRLATSSFTIAARKFNAAVVSACSRGKQRI